MLYLLGALGSLIRRNSTKFEKKYFAIVRLSNVNILILSNALKFEISVFLACREFLRFPIILLVFQYMLRVYHQKMLRFFAVINFNVLYFAFFCTAAYQYEV